MMVFVVVGGACQNYRYADTLNESNLPALIPGKYKFAWNMLIPTIWYYSPKPFYSMSPELTTHQNTMVTTIQP